MFPSHNACQICSVIDRLVILYQIRKSMWYTQLHLEQPWIIRNMQVSKIWKTELLCQAQEKQS